MIFLCYKKNSILADSRSICSHFKSFSTPLPCLLQFLFSYSYLYQYLYLWACMLSACFLSIYLPVYLPVYLSIHHHLHIISIAGTVGALPNLDTHLPHIGQLLGFQLPASAILCLKAISGDRSLHVRHTGSTWNRHAPPSPAVLNHDRNW